MALTITQQDNTIILEGNLNTSNISNFTTHFNLAQTPFNKLTIDLEKVSNIDQYALQTLKDMYKNAILNHNIFFIEGNRSEEIYESFQYPQVA
ncbi:MAG: STAS domain-containing protein [Olleya sp.]